MELFFRNWKLSVQIQKDRGYIGKGIITKRYIAHDLDHQHKFHGPNQATPIGLYIVCYCFLATKAMVRGHNRDPGARET